MDVICQYCCSKNFEMEKPADGNFSFCCHKGKVSLPALNELPPLLLSLFKGEHTNSVNFMDRIRNYNSALSFASMGAQISMPKGHGPYCFKIHGQIYHRAGVLHPESGEQRKFAQLYILDSMQAAEQRIALRENLECLPDLMDELGQLMLNQNPFAQAHKMLHEVEQEAAKEATDRGETPHEIIMAIKHDRHKDPRRYNATRSNEVAVVFENADGVPPLERDILIHLRTDSSNDNIHKTQRLSILSPNVDPMTYPLLFPRGDQGWHDEIPLQGTGRTRVTQLQYYGYRFALRDEFNAILNAGKLTQQYIVDAYVRTESNRLNFITMNQQRLRVEAYSGLMDHINRQADVEGLKAGKAVILPSSFQGSPRNMQQNYQDSMAIVRKYGKPDLFITMTCNPKWTEIIENTESWQRVENRPDLVVRVFNIKLKELLTDLTKRHVLGVVVAKIHVIEFQKRGLPHAHILIILKSEDKPRSRELIDKIVSAEIPDPDLNPRLHQIVLKNNIHGPCGVYNPSSPCMQNDKCSKNFPKEFRNETQENIDGYPQYCRRKDGKVYSIGNKTVDNSWVVPYNSFLSLKYNCHINVEICASVKGVKYLFKYVYKGHDCALVEINEHDTLTHDEVRHFVDSRYVSAPEAMWRLLSFKMHEMSHAIIRLAVHMPDEQPVYFIEGREQAAVQRSETRRTTLTAWFQLNQRDSDAKQYLYHEIPERYVFDSKTTTWNPRKRGGEKIISRMYTVSIADTERYFLRLLLLNVPGAESFDSLKTVDGVLCSSFKEAAHNRNLIEDDAVWDQTLTEAAIVQMPKQLRQLFALICVFGNPQNATSLWEKFKTDLTEDFARIHGADHDLNCELCEQHALLNIQEVLILHGKRCENYQLPSPESNMQVNFASSYEMERAKQRGAEMIATLNNEQKSVFDMITTAINENSDNSKCYFLDGPGGSGKTYLYKTLTYVIRGNGGIVLPVASTGIAANLLDGGRTYHSQFKLPVPLLETSTSNLRLNSTDAVSIKDAKLVIWDEATMAPLHALNAVEKVLREIMNNSVPFGGKVLLLGGDFRQCLPVVPHGHRSSIVQTSIKYSAMWQHFKQIKLTSNVRCEDEEYSRWLMKLGNGELESSMGDDVIEIPQVNISSRPLCKSIFGTSLSSSDMTRNAKRAILCPRNEDTDKINEEILKLLHEELHTYKSIDSMECEDDQERDNFPIEFLNSFSPSGMPLHNLKSKKGAIIMLLRNLNTRQGLCNGTRLIVKDLKNNVVLAEIITGSGSGQLVFIPKIDLAPSNSDMPFVLRRRQFPVRLAFAMTINKSQGQTLEKVGIYLPNPVFTHGQLYVAFSRVRRRSDVQVTITDSEHQGKLLKNSKAVFTRNIVFKEVL